MSGGVAVEALGMTGQALGQGSPGLRAALGRAGVVFWMPLSGGLCP